MKKISIKNIGRKSFYSDEMVVTKDYLVEHHLKLTYQRQLISNLELKHKEWSKYIIH